MVIAVLVLADIVRNNPFGKCIGIDRSRIQVPLRDVVTTIPKYLVLNIGFDAFLYDCQIEAAAHSDNCTGKRSGVLVGIDFSNTTLVQLDLTHRQTIQITQA